MDQAEKLRSVVKLKKQNYKPDARVITVTSGKGGVGKSNVAVNLAVQMQKMGKRVLVFDADFGLANVEVMFGAIPKYNLADVIYHGKQITEIISEGPMGIGFVSGGTGVTGLGNLTDEQISYLLHCFGELDQMADVILVDTGAGIANHVLEFVLASLLLGAFSPLSAFLMALMIQARHLFYGISMLGRFKNMGAKKPYLIFSLCDETFAIDNGTIIAADVDRGWFYFFVGLLNQSSWVAGATLGGLLGERITFNTSGLDFIMTAMFAVIFVDQWLTTKRKSHMAALTGIAVPAICLGVFGADNFMIPSLVAMLVMFILLRPYLDDLKIDKTDGENETNNADKETNA